MFAIFASITIKPDQRDLFIEIISDTAESSVRDEPGCVRFDVFRDEANENRYHLYEVYTDEAAFDVHLATPHAKRAMEESKDFAEGAFEVTRALSVYPTNEASFATSISP